MSTQSDGDTPLESFHDSSLSWGPEPSSPATPPVAESSGQTSSTEITPTAATAQPVNQTTPGAGAADSGPIPFERHKEILETERKQRAELESKWQRVSWVDELIQAGATREQIHEALELHRDALGNPDEFIPRLLETASSNPQLARVVRSWAERFLGSSKTDDAEPQPDLYTQHEDGTRTPVYSATRLRAWNDWNRRQMKAELQGEYAPLIADKQQRDRQKAEADVKQHFRSLAEQEVAELRKDPLFVKHTPELRAYLESVEYKVPLTKAWLHILQTKVLPTLSQTERAKTVAELQTQAAASGIKPGAATASTPKEPTSFKDKSLVW